MEKKGIKCSYAVLVIILFAALAFVTDYAYIQYKMNKCIYSNTNNIAENFYDINDLNVIGDFQNEGWQTIYDSQNIVEEIFNVEYDIWLDITGHVSIRKGGLLDRKQLNIDNVIDIINENVVVGEDLEDLIFMLTENGDVYAYKIKNSINDNYEVLKVNKISGAKKLFKSFSCGAYECKDTVFTITENNDCIAIREFDI